MVRTLLIPLVVSLIPSGIMASSPMTAQASTWFVRVKAVGDGTSPASPIGGSAELDAASKPGDVIVLLPGEGAFDGGLALKAGQTLVGVPEGGKMPSITNTGVESHGGNGVVLADGCKVLNVRIQRTKASGVLGLDVTDATLIDVEVEDTNQSAGLTTFDAAVLGRVSHGGILFLATRPGKSAENHLIRCTAKRTTGIGVGSFALQGARSRLIVDHLRAEGGTLIPPLLDIGVIAFADGKSSEAHLEMTNAVVGGRLSQQGRNIVIFASADAKARARIERSTSGEAGQDGVIALTSSVPATVEVTIRDSTIEKAGQINLEGTILNLPPADPARAHESLVSIDVERCIIRDAGFVEGFRGQEQNIWMAPSVLAPGPFARGRYRLSVRDSIVEKALKTGLSIGNVGIDFGIPSDEGEYQVRLSDNTIRDNGASDLTIATPRVRVDARRNFWGHPAGLAEGRVILLDKAERSQIDASEPLTRQEYRDRPRQVNPSGGNFPRSGGNYR